VTFEEGTWAAWLHDLLLPQVTRVVACDPRKNALLKVGNHNDRMDARKLSELLYLNKLDHVRCAGLTGLRAGELLGLNVSDLDFNRKLIHVQRSIDSRTRI